MKYLDADGQPTMVTAFQAGDQILVMAQKGEATEIRPDHLQQAEVTRVNTKEGTITVRMKDREGHETEKTFQLTGLVRYFDSAGHAAAVNVFHAGDQVLVMANKGQLSELRQDHRRTRQEK